MKKNRLSDFQPCRPFLSDLKRSKSGANNRTIYILSDGWWWRCNEIKNFVIFLSPISQKSFSSPSLLGIQKTRLSSRSFPLPLPLCREVWFLSDTGNCWLRILKGKLLTMRRGVLKNYYSPGQKWYRLIYKEELWLSTWGRRGEGGSGSPGVSGGAD